MHSARTPGYRLCKQVQCSPKMRTKARDKESRAHVDKREACAESFRYSRLLLISWLATDVTHLSVITERPLSFSLRPQEASYTFRIAKYYYSRNGFASFFFSLRTFLMKRKCRVGERIILFFFHSPCKTN